MEDCSNCGAKLPLGTPGQIQTCSFCGHQIRVPEAPPPPQPRVVVVKQHVVNAAPVVEAVSAGARGVAVLLSILAFAGVAIAITVVMVISSRSSSSSISTTGAGGGFGLGSPSKPKLDLSNIATAQISGIERIDAPGMIGTFDALDAIANVNYAMTIARAWKADAIMHRIDVDRVAKDGVANIKTTPKAQIMYRYYSPKCVHEVENSTALTPPENKCGLFVTMEVQDGAPGVFVNNTSESGHSMEGDPEIKSPVCTLAKAFAALDATGKLPARPVYDVSIYDVRFRTSDKPEPRWSFSQITSGTPTIGYVNGITCKADPAN